MVKSHRGADTHFLSAQEIITAAAHQNLNPNKCKQADEGVFGSKFVTICVSGNKDNEVHMEGYQVTTETKPSCRTPYGTIVSRSPTSVWL